MNGEPASSPPPSTDAAPGTLPPPGPTGLAAWLCILASGSSGNCSVLVIDREGVRRACLIDLGLSPRRTLRLLHALGIGMHAIDDAVLTHLDRDHYHPNWAQFLPAHATLRLHIRHEMQARCWRLPMPRRVIPFELSCGLSSGARVRARVMDHDELGSCAMRLDCGAGELGFATDLGRVTDALVEHLLGVDVLAIESNYCPRLQAASDRPEFLKRRITGGAGHLSNEQCAVATRMIGPRGHVVLLHLSAQCNEPGIAARHHDGAPYGLTVAPRDEPSPWVRIAATPGAPGGPPSLARPAGAVPARPVQRLLFAGA
jgi:phosphoribosyl 1,2-cyclic phosphodiesterase